MLPINAIARAGTPAPVNLSDYLAMMQRVADIESTHRTGDICLRRAAEFCTPDHLAQFQLAIVGVREMAASVERQCREIERLIEKVQA